MGDCWASLVANASIQRVRLKVMPTNTAMLQITPGVQGLPCLLTPNARQALHSSIIFNRTRIQPNG